MASTRKALVHIRSNMEKLVRGWFDQYSCKAYWEDIGLEISMLITSYI